jgi:hypothetical protein
MKNSAVKENFRRFLEQCVRERTIKGFVKVHGGLDKTDFIINFEYSPDLPVKVVNYIVWRDDVKNYERQGICLVIINGSDNIERIRDKFIAAQRDFRAARAGRRKSEQPYLTGSFQTRIKQLLSVR